MRPSPSLSAPAHLDEVISRLAALTPETPRRWGTMTADEMLCHLADSFRATLGERPASSATTWASRTIMKWVALHTPLPWPKGLPTRPEVNPKKLGTRPIEFERDRQAVVDLIRRFVAKGVTYDRHPTFGAMSNSEWLVWAYRHLDHHLRQFGL